MQESATLFRIVFFACAGFASLALAADTPAENVPREHHRWARFEPGAWNLARIVIENFNNEKVDSTSTIEQRTTLLEVDNESVLLRIEAKIEVDGKKFDAPVQTVRQLFTGDNISPTSTYEIKPAGSGTVTIEGQAYPCQVLNIEIADPSGTTTIKCYYAPGVEPYLLRSESKINTDEKVSQQSTSETLALDMPFFLGSSLASQTVVQETVSKAKSVERSLVYRSFDVPGATLNRSSKELDQEGHLIRRSTFELLDFGVGP